MGSILEVEMQDLSAKHIIYIILSLNLSKKLMWKVMYIVAFVFRIHA